MTAAQVLRDYQLGGRSQIFEAWLKGARSVLSVLPTGGGKTTVFSDIARQIACPVVILVHRREHATQAANRLREFGVDFGYIVSGFPYKPYARVQIASVQTLVRRELPPAGLVICDEAHLSTAATWAKILAAYPNARILGVTATPWRLSGKPLAGAYDSCVVMATPRELREQGHLCDYAGFSYLAPDLDDVETVAGEFNAEQTDQVMRQPSIVANIVEQWKAHASDLSTIVFAVSVEHSIELAKEFRAAGVQAEHLDGDTPENVRAAILRRVSQGHTRVLCNVGVLIEGLDIPRLKCCVFARPTMSLARCLQMAGRVRRVCKRCLKCGEDYPPDRNRPACPKCGSLEHRMLRARIHDHAFLIKRHGLPDDERDYRLNAKPEKPPEISHCPDCHGNYHGRSCPECGAEEPEPKEKRELVTVDEAEQFEFDSNSAAPASFVEVKPPVDVRWDTAGRSVEGVYLSKADELVQFVRGQSRVTIYTLQGKKRIYRLPGTAHLNELMGKHAQISDLIRVTYTGDEAAGGGRHRKHFELEIDDGS